MRLSYRVEKLTELFAALEKLEKTPERFEVYYRNGQMTIDVYDLDDSIDELIQAVLNGATFIDALFEERDEKNCSIRATVFSR